MSQKYTKKSIHQYTYFLKNKIGEGAYSEVFRGNHQQTGQNAAIKVVSLNKTIKNNTFRNVQQQISTLYKLKNIHNVVQVKEVVQTKSNIYIITEFCDQGNLRQWIQQEKQFQQKTSIGVIQQIINGYRSITKAGFIHRDLKPENIFVKGSDVKIGDFGFAINANECGSPLNQNIGSPLYMAPQALNSNKYSFQSDIWAIGLIFFEMLSGSSPWKSKTQTQLKSQLIQYKIQNFLPKNISAISKQFLLRTVQVNLFKRMTLEQLLKFSFGDLQNEKIQPSIKQKNNCQDKSTVAQCANQVSLKKALTHNNENHSVVHLLEANRSVPNLNQPKCKKIQNKKTISYSNQFQEEIVESKEEKFLKEIDKQASSCVIQKTYKVQNVASQRILRANNQNPLEKIEKQRLLKNASIQKFLKRSTSVISYFNEGKSNKNIVTPFVNSINLQELPQLNDNEDQQKDQKTFRVMKQNKSNNLNNKLQKIPQQHQDFLNNKLIQSLYIDRTTEKSAQNGKTLEGQNQFAEELKQLTIQIYYLKFLSQIIKDISLYLKTSNEKIQIFKSNIAFLILQKLKQLKSLTPLKITPQKAQAFFKTKQYDYCTTLIKQISQKYTKRHSMIQPEFKSQKDFISTLSFVLSLIYKNVLKYQHNQEEMNRKKMILVILDSLISLSSLYFLDKQQNWSKFQLKSHIQELYSRRIPSYVDKLYFQSVCKRYIQLTKK